LYRVRSLRAVAIQTDTPRNGVTGNAIDRRAADAELASNGGRSKPVLPRLLNLARIYGRLPAFVPWFSRRLLSIPDHPQLIRGPGSVSFPMWINFMSENVPFPDERDRSPVVAMPFSYVTRSRSSCPIMLPVVNWKTLGSFRRDTQGRWEETSPGPLVHPPPTHSRRRQSSLTPATGLASGRHLDWHG
jgi:hypothetical protein